MVFMGCGFTSGGQESGSMFSAAVYKIKAGECYIESLPLVLKDKRNCFSQAERKQLIMCFPSGSRTLNWHLETIYKPSP